MQPKKIGSVYHASVMRGCVPLSASSSLTYYHCWSLKHHHSAATRHHHCPGKLHACRANNNYFLYFVFYFLLYLFGIVFNCIIQNNIFLYTYLLQMHQIIHLSPVGCFTTARGKTVQKNREVSWVNDRISVWKPRGLVSNSLWHQRFFHMSLSLKKVFIYIYILQHKSYL